MSTRPEAVGERVLYGAETETARLWRYRVPAPGRLENLPYPVPERRHARARRQRYLPTVRLARGRTGRPRLRGDAGAGRGLQIELVGEIVRLIDLGLDGKRAALSAHEAGSVKVVAGAYNALCLLLSVPRLIGRR